MLCTHQTPFTGQSLVHYTRHSTGTPYTRTLYTRQIFPCTTEPLICTGKNVQYMRHKKLGCSKIIIIFYSFTKSYSLSKFPVYILIGIQGSGVRGKCPAYGIPVNEFLPISYTGRPVYGNLLKSAFFNL